MKNSGVEWIGEIPDDWKITKILNCLRKRISDGPHETPTYVENGIPFISVDSLNETEYVDLSFVNRYISEVDYLEYCKKANLEENDILFSKAATIGKTAIVHADEKFMVWSPIAILKTNSSLDNRFLYFLLNYDGLITHISFLGSINTQINVGMRELEQARIPLPPKVTQQKIASYLDSKCLKIEETIQNQQQVIEKLKAYKQSLITEAVTGKIKIQNGKVCGKYEEYKDSGVEWIGDIPKGWISPKISYLTTKIGSGKTPYGGAATYLNEGILFIRSQNVYDEGLTITEPLYISEEIDEEMKGTRVFDKDVLLNITGGSIGRCCVYDKKFGKANVNQHVCIIRVIQDKILPKYMQLFWNSIIGKRAIDIYQTGGNREGMSGDAISKTVLPLPNIEEQKSIVEYLEKKCTGINNAIEQKQKLIEKLTEYKKSLIYECVTGKKEI